MSRKLALFLALMLSGLSIGSFAQPADAQTPLTRAVIQALRNRVRLMQRNRPVRSAQVSDAMTPGDALSTARASLAELRFNDGSLARVGEQAVFRFVPNARTFQLSNGTLLLLIPPGRGPTGIRTPNAAAGIKGSALFVRYIPGTDTTLVGALTNNPQGPMVIYNRDGSQSQDLRAGQLAVVVKNRIENVYDFDLNTFYETSDLVKGLNLTQKESTSLSDEAIAAVRAETVEALQGQSPFAEANVIENPTFVRLPSDLTSSADFPANNLDRVFNSLDVRRVVEAGEAQFEQTAVSSQQVNGSFTGEPSANRGTPPPSVTQTSKPVPSAPGQSANGPSITLPPQPAASVATPATPPLGQKVVPDSRILSPRVAPPLTGVGQPSSPQPPVAPPPVSVSTPQPPIAFPPAQTPGSAPVTQTPAEPPNITPPAAVVTPPVTQTPAGPPNITPPAAVVTPPVTQTPAEPPATQPPTQAPNPPVLIEPVTGGSVIPIDPTLPATPPAVTPPTVTPPPATPPGDPGNPPPTTGQPNGSGTGGNFPGQGATNGNFPGGGATNGNFPGQGASGN